LTFSERLKVQTSMLDFSKVAKISGYEFMKMIKKNIFEDFNRFFLRNLT